MSRPLEEDVPVAGGICVSTNYEVVACSNRGKKKRNIPFLPNDVVFNILLFLPADILYNVMRLVCRNWKNIINDPDFINAHLHRSATGLLIQNTGMALFPSSKHFSYFLDMEEGIDNDRKRLGNLWFSWLRVACCDGLVLTRDPKNLKVFHIVNPIRKQHVTLTPPPSSLSSSASAIAFAPLTKEYKVVHTYFTCGPSIKYEVLVLTVGVDSRWRYINTEQFNHGYFGVYFTYESPISVGGFIYWHCSKFPFVLALDVEAETIHRVSISEKIQPREREHVRYIKSENFLILAISFDRMWDFWDFWALVDTKKGEWTKLFRVDLRAPEHGLFSYSRLYGIYPLAVLKGDVVVFRTWRKVIYIAYGVKAGNILEVEQVHCYLSNTVVAAHVNSLVPPKSS